MPRPTLESRLRAAASLCISVAACQSPNAPPTSRPDETAAPASTAATSNNGPASLPSNPSGSLPDTSSLASETATSLAPPETPSEGSTNVSPNTDAASSAVEDTSADSSGATSSAPPTTEQGVSISDGRIFVDGRPFQIRGVNWNPVPKGGTHPQDLDFAGYVEQDAALMQAAGINAVRTYEHLSDTAVLDTLQRHGISVFTTVYGWWQDDPSVVTSRVNAVKGHPAVIAYVLGNEWNYNQLYANGAISTEQARDQINQAAALVKQADPTRPVTTIYGELGDIQAMIQAMPDIDLWGINAYRGLSLGNLFDDFALASNKPLYLGEFGADAYNALIDAYDPDSQAEATAALLGELNHAVGENRAVGGFLFEWADEWWKDNSGAPDVHDTGGIAPGGGPHPDQTFNEEWWGLVDIDRNPRPAYTTTQTIYAP